MQTQFVSRAGQKLDGAIQALGLDVAGCVCADFGCNVGGFTDCLLQRGAARVYAIDTGYGELAWKLRKDPRVVVMERTNALHLEPPESADLVVIDVAWTPQTMSVPAAAKWLKPDSLGIISLLKPHYEMTRLAGKKPHAALMPQQSHQVCLEVCQKLGELGLPPQAVMQSTLIGKGGNLEFLLHIKPAAGL